MASWGETVPRCVHSGYSVGLARPWSLSGKDETGYVLLEGLKFHIVGRRGHVELVVVEDVSV